MKYRILEEENKAGGRKYYTQYLRTRFFGLFSYWQNFYYWKHSQQLVEYDFLKAFDTFCEARNSIKYHKMFNKDKNIIKVHEIN